MSSKRKRNFKKEHENTWTTVEDDLYSQSLNIASDANDKDESRLSHDKSQQTDSVYKPPESTSDVFWKDPKFWIQIGIMGVIQLVICVYMSASWKRDTENLISCRKGGVASESSCEDCFSDAACKLSQRYVLNIANQKEFKNLLEVDWDRRKKVLEKDFIRNFKDLFDEEWDLRKKIPEEDLSRKLKDKDTVVFNAVVTKSRQFERNTPINIIYDQVLYDTHNAYSNQTGAFTAPMDGLYVFTWTTLVEAKKIMNTELLVSRIRTGRGSCDNEGSNGYDNCSNTVSVLLKAGDEVSIRSATGNYIYGHEWSSFKGWKT